MELCANYRLTHLYYNSYSTQNNDDDDVAEKFCGMFWGHKVFTLYNIYSRYTYTFNELKYNKYMWKLRDDARWINKM